MPNQNILLTVDALIFSQKNAKRSILLIKRQNEPFQNLWAFPGGFVEDNESLEEAASRELFEETALDMDIRNLNQLQAFGNPIRDPRGRIVTVAFFGFIASNLMDIVEADTDAAEARWFYLDDLPVLAFDHLHILQKALMDIDRLEAD